VCGGEENLQEIGGFSTELLNYLWTYRLWKSMMKRVLKHFTKGKSRGRRPAKIYLAKQNKVGRNRKGKSFTS
jgi:hypothetical protein